MVALSKIKIYNKLFQLREFHNPIRPFESLNTGQLQSIKNFNSKIQNGEIEFETVPCLCGGLDFDNIADTDSKLFLQQTVICKNCGLIQSNPRMTEKQYKQFYMSDFYRISYEGVDFLDDIYKKRYTPAKGMHIFEEVKQVKEISKSTNVLEVGAGGGWNLISFLNVGAKVLGIDYSTELISMGRENGINMIQGGIDAISGKYDIIILNHVLEHFLNPILDLKIIANHLTENGILYIAVPNIMYFNLGQFQNAHTYYFTPETLKYYLSCSGLRMIKFGVAQKIHMFGIFSISGTNSEIDLSDNYHYMIKFLRKEKYKFLILKFSKRIYLYQILRFIFRMTKRLFS